MLGATFPVPPMLPGLLVLPTPVLATQGEDKNSSFPSSAARVPWLRQAGETSAQHPSDRIDVHPKAASSWLLSTGWMAAVVPAAFTHGGQFRAGPHWRVNKTSLL